MVSYFQLAHTCNLLAKLNHTSKLSKKEDTLLGKFVTWWSHLHGLHFLCFILQFPHLCKYFRVVASLLKVLILQHAINMRRQFKMDQQNTYTLELSSAKGTYCGSYFTCCCTTKDSTHWHPWDISGSHQRIGEKDLQGRSTVLKEVWRRGVRKFGDIKLKIHLEIKYSLKFV